MDQGQLHPLDPRLRGDDEIFGLVRSDNSDSPGINLYLPTSAEPPATTQHSMIKSITKHRMIAVCLAFMLPAMALAAQDQTIPPRQVAEQTVQQLLEAMDGRRDELRNNPQQLQALVDRILLPLVDVDYMSQLVLGRYWRTATPQQRQRFEQAFKTMLVRTYGNALLEFDDEQIKYMPVRAPKGADNITFRATIITKSGENVKVSLDMHLVDGQWKVYDGRVGHLSFVTNYQSQFANYIRNHGLEALIEAMEKRYGSGS